MIRGLKDLDPICGATLQPVGTLARAVWEKWLPISQLRATFNYAKDITRWDQAKGPVGTAVLSP
eukprot:9028522-Pyramimonas_sp.AAC.1